MTGGLHAILDRARGVALRALRRPDMRREDGAATVEFVILAPVFFILFASSLEASIFMTRQIYLERATDMATREIRLDGQSVRSRAQLITDICDNAPILGADCQNDMVVELIDLGQPPFAIPDYSQPCITRENLTTVEELETRQQATQTNAAWVPNRASRIMLMRACFAARPLLPLSGVGANLVNDRDGRTVSMVTATAFRVEPR
jgi:hypothetical protein